MTFDPVLKQRRDGVRQAQQHKSRSIRARLRRRFENARHLMIGDGWNNGCDHDVHGNACPRQRAHGVETMRRKRRTRLQARGEARVQRGDGNEHHDRLMSRQFCEQINVARDEMVFGHDADGIAELREHFQAAPRDPQPALHGLVTIGDAAHRDDLRFPLRRGEFLAQQLRPVLLDHDARLEIQPGREAEIFVRGPGVAINAAVLAATIWIDTRVEADVRAVVVIDERLRGVAKILCAGSAVLLRVPLVVRLDVNSFEAIRRVVRRTAPLDGWRAGSQIRESCAALLQREKLYKRPVTVTTAQAGKLRNADRRDHTPIWFAFPVPLSAGSCSTRAG